MAFLNRMFRPCELSIQDLPEHDDRMRVGPYGGILFLLPQHVQDFVCDIKVHDLGEETRSDFVVSFWSYGVRKT